MDVSQCKGLFGMRSYGVEHKQFILRFYALYDYMYDWASQSHLATLLKWIELKVILRTVVVCYQVHRIVIYVLDIEIHILPLGFFQRIFPNYHGA